MGGMFPSGPHPKTDVHDAVRALKRGKSGSEPPFCVDFPSKRVDCDDSPLIRGGPSVIERESTRTCPGTSFPGSGSTDIRNKLSHRAFPDLAIRFRFTLESCHVADIPDRQVRANSGHSISSSARPDSVSGTVSPSALAVLRLMMSLYLSGCWTGRSLGFAPLRIRST